MSQHKIQAWNKLSFSYYSRFMTIGKDWYEDWFINRQIAVFESSHFVTTSDKAHAKHKSPCSAVGHTWIPLKVTWTSWPAAVYCCLLAVYSGLVFWRDIISFLFSANFNSHMVSHSWKPIKCALKTFLKRCKQHQIVCKKQMCDPACFNSDNLADLA